ncbi:hypothetical protein [Bdellovibrio sp. HCB-110]|uniref:hypothetical protein n=1 Tax=Bdellovibrio sp. HCB-110 TaxID=3391182 RepID=UPI0039B4F1F1
MKVGKGHMVYLVFILSLLIVSCTPKKEVVQQVQVIKCEQGKPVTGYFSVAKDTPMKEKPSHKSKTKINAKATELLGKADYRILDGDYRLKSFCETEKWVYAMIVKIDEADVQGEFGWIPKSAIKDLSQQAPPKNRKAEDKFDCYEKGIKYYKSIGSYPRLSTGESAEQITELKCSRTIGAFDTGLLQ